MEVLGIPDEPLSWVLGIPDEEALSWGVGYPGWTIILRCCVSRIKHYFECLVYFLKKVIKEKKLKWSNKIAKVLQADIHVQTSYTLEISFVDT